MSIRNELLEKILEALGGQPAEINVSQSSLGQFYTTSSQDPTGLGAGGVITVNFGAGGSTTDGEFDVASDGVITCNKKSIQYDFEVTLRLERQGTPGVSEIMARMMYAEDGVNYVQAGLTFGVRIDDDDTKWRENFSVKFSPAVGSKLYIEVARNNGSNDSGGVGAYQPSGDLSGWLPIPSASLEILKTVVG